MTKEVFFVMVMNRFLKKESALSNIILIVDDHPANVRTATRLVESVVRIHGGAPRIYGEMSPQSVLEMMDSLAQASRILAILDYNMPEMTGLELLAALRLQLRSPIEAVFYSSDPSGENRAGVQAAGELFLQKPEDEGLLRLRVQQFLTPV